MSARRPTRPTIELTDTAARLIRSGCPIEAVATYLLGARSGDLFEWLVIGAGLHPTRYKIRVPKCFRDFHDKIIRAQAEAELKQVAALEKKGSDRYRMFWLERRAPARWSKTEKLEVSTPETQRALVERIRQIREDNRFSDPRLAGMSYEEIATRQDVWERLYGAPPFDAPLAERLAFLRTHLPRALPPAAEPVVEHVQADPVIVDAPPHIGLYAPIDVTPPEPETPSPSVPFRPPSSSGNPASVPIRGK